MSNSNTLKKRVETMLSLATVKYAPTIPEVCTVLFKVPGERLSAVYEDLLSKDSQPVEFYNLIAQDQPAVAQQLASKHPETKVVLWLPELEPDIDESMLEDISA